MAVAGARQEFGVAMDDFRLNALSGEETSLQACLEGKKGGVVVFWSGVCSHCARYDEYLNSFARRRPEIGMLAVASRQGESLPQIRATVTERSLTFPILYDAGGRLAAAWSVQQTPRVFLVDANRVLLYRGAIDNFKYPEDSEYAPYLEPAISQFLAGEPLTRTETASYGCAIKSVYYILPKAL
jgi:peroxiredoxin